MAVIPSEESDTEKAETALRSEARSDETPPLTGMEINLGDFTRTQGLMKSLRLMLNNQIVVQVEEIASGVSEAGRKFKMGELEQANVDIARLYSAFGQRTNQWESQARSLVEKMKAEAAKIGKLNRTTEQGRDYNSCHNAVPKFRLPRNRWRILHQGLEKLPVHLPCRPPPISGLPPLQSAA